MMSNVIDLAAWKAKQIKPRKPHWRSMSETQHMTLSAKDALEYIAFAVWYRDLQDGFDGEITCELNEDGSVEVYAVQKIEIPEEDTNSLN